MFSYNGSYQLKDHVSKTDTHNLFLAFVVARVAGQIFSDKSKSSVRNLIKKLVKVFKGGKRKKTNGYLFVETGRKIFRIRLTLDGERG